MSRYGAWMGAADRWNERYTQSLEPFPHTPAAWLVEHEGLLAGGGRGLDVACGDGRNALYLARHGYEVAAIDASDVAVGALNAAALERGLPITAHVVDVEAEPLPAGPYDAIVVMNFLDRALFGSLRDALAPGGLLFYETLSVAHVEELGRSFNADYLLARGELLEAFGDLEVVAHAEGVVERAGGPRGVASIVARRPARPPAAR
jgi:SAM-dependent methyltransferase